jgi:SAM-dependent methyltransferase
MKKLTHEETIIYNEGERLIPGVTHDIAEFVRHRSSYMFFRKIIEKDLAKLSKKNVSIVDLGCGVGHGCAMMSKIKNSSILGVDSSSESLEYAKHRYAGKNIQYSREDLTVFVPNMAEHDYVVSRGVLEHVPNGINLALLSKWRMRLMFDVPYAEPSGRNLHHIIHDINEQTFAGIPDAELFYEDIDGNIYDVANKPSFPNLIMCVVSSPDLPDVGSFMKFPHHAYKTFDQRIVLIFQSISWNKAAQILNRILRLPIKAIKRIVRSFKSI